MSPGCFAVLDCLAGASVPGADVRPHARPRSAVPLPAAPLFSLPGPLLRLLHSPFGLPDPLFRLPGSHFCLLHSPFGLRCSPFGFLGEFTPGWDQAALTVTPAQPVRPLAF